jgi:hypothetical protein
VRLEPPARRALERAGWRTTLDYREDHVRGRGGRLVEVRATWIATAERADAPGIVVSAASSTPDDAWSELADDAERARRS